MLFHTAEELITFLGGQQALVRRAIKAPGLKVDWFFTDVLQGELLRHGLDVEQRDAIPQDVMQQAAQLLEEAYNALPRAFISMTHPAA